MPKKSYTIKGKTSKICATSRCAIHINDNYYTIEASEERTLDTEESVDLNKEWADIFNSINTIVDNQCEEIVQTFKK